MKYALPLLLLLAGCGVNPKPVGFVNRTPHPDAYLEAQWAAAQDFIATTPIQINPIDTIGSSTTAQPTYWSPDPRARSVQPRQYLVKAVPDASAAQVYAVSGFWPPEVPTGYIVCPQPCDTRAASAYSTPGVGTYYASSWDSSTQSIDYILTYEFENAILYQLGYNTNRR